jgi:putative endonuclease
MQAKNYLVSLGYQIINTNWKLKSGELDIVARDKKELVFVEVKTRKGVNSAFPPADAVDYKKISKIKFLSGFFLDRNKYLLEHMEIEAIRYDVIGISVTGKKEFELEHRKDAFD